jgi:ABC-type bacteriocin/lantibiotic exporter with double-glycine peptidase domain
MTHPPSAPSSILQARAVVELLAGAHGVVYDHDALDATARRLAASAPTADITEAINVFAAEAGLAVARVRRSLRDVVDDADPTMPWVAVRHTAGGEADAIAVLDRQRGGARVAVPGAHYRPGRWSLASLRAWLGVAGDHDVIEWLLAEPAAPLASMRSASPDNRRLPFSRIRALLGAERRTLWVAVVYSAVIGLLSLVVPIAVQLLVNTIAFGSLLQPLAVLMLAVFVALGFSTALNALRAAVVEIIQKSIFARVATDVTWRLLRVRADAFDRYHGPELVNRFFDTVTVQKSAALLLIDGLSILMQTTIGMVLLAVYHPFLLAFDVFLVGAMLFIVLVLGRGAVGTAIKESKAKYALEAWLEQIAAHLVTFKSAGAPAFAAERSRRMLEDYLEYRTKHFKILIRQVLGSFALQAIASSALLGIGGFLVIDRQLTLGQLVASELVVTLMMSAFTKFGKQLEVYYDLSAAIDKLGDLIDLPLERAGGEAVLTGTGPLAIEMRDVDVRYPDGTRAALSVRHWAVTPGEHVGVTGPNGSGKSTLADVLFGLRTTTAGAVRVDGVDVRDLPLSALRAAVGLVRGVELFPGTVLDNVRLGRANVSHADVTAALAAVGLLDELLRLPQGLETVLNPHGRPLSYRQACRLMIARAVVARPRLLVIDGALDTIDQPDERARLDAIVFDPASPWTVVCITERPDVLARCSRVVRLHDGEIREEVSR